MANKITDFVLKTANVLGIYKNYSVQKSRDKVLIVTHVTIQTAFLSYLIFDTIFTAVAGPCNTKSTKIAMISFHVTSAVNACVLLWNSIKHSRCFNDFMTDFMDI